MNRSNNASPHESGNYFGAMPMIRNPQGKYQGFFERREYGRS
jgi:hypothetical protein